MQTFWYTGRKEYEAQDALLSPTGGRLEARKRNDQDTKNNDTNKKKRRINRPGFNSYLKVLLEDQSE